MVDELPLWFWLPLAIILWTVVLVTYVRLRLAQRAEERAEAERIALWYWYADTNHTDGSAS